jgi:rubrerythrin
MEKSWEEYSGVAQPKELQLTTLLIDCFHAELGAIAAYTYRSLITEGISRELSDTFDRIATHETEHFRLVGSLILSLGADPEIGTRIRKVSHVLESCEDRSYDHSLTAMIDAAVGEEYAEIDRYRKAMAHTDDRIFRAFLAQLIADEERHVRMLVTML